MCQSMSLFTYPEKIFQIAYYMVQCWNMIFGDGAQILEAACSNRKVNILKSHSSSLIVFFPMLLFHLRQYFHPLAKNTTSNIPYLFFLLYNFQKN